MTPRLRGRIYELRRGDWTELDEPPRPTAGWRGPGTLLVAAVSIAAMVAIGIVATAITIIVLPVALVIAWRLHRRTRASSRA